MEEDEFEGDAIADLLVRPGAAAILAALPGCSVYRDDPDAAVIIRSCDGQALQIHVEDRAGHVRAYPLRGRYVVSTDGRLRAAIESNVTEDDRARELAVRRIATFGMAGRIEAGDIADLAQAIEGIERGVLPGLADRRRTTALARKYGSPRIVLRFTDHWRRLAGSSIPADILIEHVACLRELGEIENALAGTEILRRNDHDLAPSAQGVLFTQRAALWLDLYELRRDSTHLDQAQQAADRSWAIGPSRECRGVYGRLRKLREDD
ncbi:hypothetical protein [Sphingomonas sp.]|uniref:hypothetical protein n=1 Tax=Sphingomonas sp. TaxID=28214 RepID=UPI0035B396EC